MAGGVDGVKSVGAKVFLVLTPTYTFPWALWPDDGSCGTLVLIVGALKKKKDMLLTLQRVSQARRPARLLTQIFRDT